MISNTLQQACKKKKNQDWANEKHLLFLFVTRTLREKDHNDPFKAGSTGHATSTNPKTKVAAEHKESSGRMSFAANV